MLDNCSATELHPTSAPLFLNLPYTAFVIMHFIVLYCLLIVLAYGLQTDSWCLEVGESDVRVFHFLEH